jgi:hypothetical protein
MVCLLLSKSSQILRALLAHVSTIVIARHYLRRGTSAPRFGGSSTSFEVHMNAARQYRLEKHAFFTEMDYTSRPGTCDTHDNSRTPAIPHRPGSPHLRGVPKCISILIEASDSHCARARTVRHVTAFSFDRRSDEREPNVRSTRRASPPRNQTSGARPLRELVLAPSIGPRHSACYLAALSLPAA